ncbi:MAG: starch synthase, partial [Gemmatimonadales bacterium]|nr:starch synthase [Gemmatimonadales bacterium]
TSEAVPFAKTGGLADVAGALPPALARLGHDVRLALPKYSAIDSAKIQSRPVGEPFEVPLGDQSVTVSVQVSEALDGVPTYLLDCPQYFQRDGLYGQRDDAERFALFCLAVLRLVERDDWRPQVI